MTISVNIITDLLCAPIFERVGGRSNPIASSTSTFEWSTGRLQIREGVRDLLDSAWKLPKNNPQVQHICVLYGGRPIIWSVSKQIPHPGLLVRSNPGLNSLITLKVSFSLGLDSCRFGSEVKTMNPRTCQPRCRPSVHSAHQLSFSRRGSHAVAPDNISHYTELRNVGFSATRVGDCSAL
jgi:hypothetical protein